MVAFNFKPEFVDLIKSGIKTQTIREKARCKIGDNLQLYTGMRTKACKKIIDAVCTSITPIYIDSGSEIVKLGSHRLNAAQLEELAIKDGFNNDDNFLLFFNDNYGEFFNGYLITWSLEPQNASPER